MHTTRNTFLLLIGIVLIALICVQPAAALTKLSIASSKSGQISGAIAQSDTIDARVLAANVAESHTVPTGAKYVLFTCITATGSAATFWADLGGGTAAIPAADITNGSGAEVNPVLRYVGGVASISLIAPAACIVVMAWYE